jgi:hypothetical protein
LDVSYRSSTSTFRVTSGYIYSYNTLTTGDIGPNYHLFVSLYSVDNDEIYSTIDVSWPTSAGTKTSTLHWSSVPTGNYKLLFSSGQDGTRYAPVGRVSGTIYDGPR